jgi:hypothetical protein
MRKPWWQLDWENARMAATETELVIVVPKDVYELPTNRAAML